MNFAFLGTMNPQAIQWPLFSSKITGDVNFSTLRPRRKRSWGLARSCKDQATHITPGALWNPAGVCGPVLSPIQPGTCTFLECPVLLLLFMFPSFLVLASLFVLILAPVFFAPVLAPFLAPIFCSCSCFSHFMFLDLFRFLLLELSGPGLQRHLKRSPKLLPGEAFNFSLTHNALSLDTQAELQGPIAAIIGAQGSKMKI